MRLVIHRQDTQSRGELLLRTFFGWLYIILPHIFVLMFVSLWASILSFIAFWSILFTGRYPQSFFEFQVGLHKWNMRLNGVLVNLFDGYPAFGVSAEHPNVELEIPYPENLSKGKALLKVLFGWFYVGIPHGLALGFIAMAVNIISFIGFWAVLFTGRFPEGMHTFIVGFLRWSLRVNLYLGLMTDEYPPFSFD